VIFTCERGSNVERVSCPPSLLVWDRFFKSFHPSLFCRFNKKKNLIEVWDIDLNGKEYFVKEIKTSLGKFRFPDYRDIYDLWKRSFERKRKVWRLEDEVDRIDDEWEHWQDLHHQHINYQISMEKYNIIFNNPMIGGE